MEIGVAAYLKKINKSLVLSKIIKHELISRSELANITKLTKATISSQTAELLDEGLIIESHQEYNQVGRKPIMLSLNQDAGYALGIDLDFRNIIFTVSDLIGNPVHSNTVELENSKYDEILQILINKIREYQERFSHCRFGLVGVGIGIHGTVKKDETISFVPHHKWYKKDLKGDLEKNVNTAVYVENNANLCAFAEKVFHFHQSNDLISLSMFSGIGLGILFNGELVKGYHGFAGEMGHMIISPDGKPCNCGKTGCWELYASEVSFFKNLSEIIDKPRLTHQDIKNLVIARNPAVISQMDNFIKYVSIGLNNIINLLNPEILVLNSELLKLFPDAMNTLELNLKTSISNYKEIFISDLGTNACVMGACALTIKKFLDIPELNLTIKQEVLVPSI
ncbi:ROK family transcriptional regulator [Neobacillus drentensis]|uniref:ROK family transcriptional regulator n=1 Tax=Neobacillus drentensis TaxID=220684 RepID=UPI0030000C97